MLGHPGGPFWRRKDLGAWSISKGLIAPDETPLAARDAKRDISDPQTSRHRPARRCRPEMGLEKIMAL